MPYFNVQKAKQAGYTDAQISDFMAKNKLEAGNDEHQSKRIQELQQSGPTQGTGNALFDLALGIVKPVGKAFSNTALRTGEAVNQLGRFATDKAFRKSVLGQDLTEEEMLKVANDPAGKYLSNEQLDRKQLLNDVTKDSAMIGSLAVPGGGTWGQVIGRGALSGGAYGYGASEQGKEVGDTLKGAAGGAVGGALFKGLGSVFKGLSKAGNAVDESLANPIVRANPYGAVEEKAIIKGLKNLGLTGRPKEVYGKLPGAMDDLSGQIGGILDKSKKKVKTADILTAIETQLGDNINFIGDEAQNKAREKFTNQLFNQANKSGKNGLTLTGRDLFNFKQNLGKQLKPAFNKLEKGNPLTSSEEVAMSIWQSMDDLVTKSFPEVKDLTLLQSTLFKAAPGLKKKAGEKVSAQLLGTSVPVGGLIRGGQAGISKVGQKAGNVSNSALFNKIINTGIRTGGPVGGALASQIGGQSISQDVAPVSNDLPLTGLQMEPPEATNPNEITKEMLFAGRQQLNDKDYKKLTELYDLQQGDKQTSTMRKDSSIARSGLRGIQEIRRIYEQDPLVLQKQALSGGLNNRQLDSATFRAIDAILRLRTGATAPEEEIRRYQKQLGLTARDIKPEDVRYKLDQLEQDLNDALQGAGGEPDINSAIEVLKSQGIF